MDELSIWDLGLKLGGDDPYLSVQDNIRTESKDAIRFLIRQLENNLLTGLVRGTGAFTPLDFICVFDRNEYFQCLGLNETDHITTGEFDESALRSIFIERSNFLRFCLLNNRAFPDFWGSELELGIEMGWMTRGASEDDTSETEGSSKTTVSNLDKILPSTKTAIACQVVAEQLWKMNPDLTIAEMSQRDEIQILCGAQNYQGVNTVRNWIKAIAPLEKRQPGRPARKNKTHADI